MTLKTANTIPLIYFPKLTYAKNLALKDTALRDHDLKINKKSSYLTFA